MILGTYEINSFGDLPDNLNIDLANTEHTVGAFPANPLLHLTGSESPTPLDWGHWT